MGALSDFFESDHRRLAALLDRSAGGGIHEELYGEFRAGIFAHLAMEERCVLPAIVEAKGGKPLLTARRILAEHRAIRAVLALPPSAGAVAVLRRVLEHHATLEDGPGGLYGSSDDLLGPRAEEVLAACRSYRPDPAAVPPAQVNAYDDALRALEHAGYDVSESDLRP